ncbi:hypothetical protein ACLKA7_011672 [Drosophila subpalustris]
MHTPPSAYSSTYLTVSQVPRPLPQVPVCSSDININTMFNNDNTQSQHFAVESSVQGTRATLTICNNTSCNRKSAT